VPATLASRVRVLASGQSTTCDPNDAHNTLARWRNKLCCRLHALVGELGPGGISREVVVDQARSFLAGIQPEDVASVERHRQALEIVGEIDRLDDQLCDSRQRITVAVAASGTTLTEVFGIGRSSPACSSASPATRHGSPTAARLPPTRGRRRSSSPPAAASHTGLFGEVTTRTLNRHYDHRPHRPGG